VLGVERAEPDEAVHALLGAVQAVRVLALDLKVADLMPASSPGLTSSRSTPKPRFSAQRISMRRTISAQSWASVPPAPAFTVTSASPASYWPANSRCSSSSARLASTCATRSSNSAARSASSATSSMSPSNSSTSACRAS
jgi:hypothetical protein